MSVFFITGGNKVLDMKPQEEYYPKDIRYILAAGILKKERKPQRSLGLNAF